ncbi:MAG TPA: type II toxin-antitoxin system prevent-host-death family antitoxin [Spirochaetia bacterium]|nr:type II toxin-antitoxin system prevent-host-death family antitoxin [Spirochaetia bacterium]
MQQDQLRFSGLHELRAHLAEAVNRAAYGHQPTVVLRRRTKLAVVVSIDDFLFLERMKQRRAEALSEEPPKDPARVGAYLARKLEAEMRYG